MAYFLQTKSYSFLLFIFSLLICNSIVKITTYNNICKVVKTLLFIPYIIIINPYPEWFIP